MDQRLSEVFGWLDVAWWKLKEKATSDRTARKYVRNLNDDDNQTYTAERTLTEHWAAWKDRL
jgi:hypothetical protein